MKAGGRWGVLRRAASSSARGAAFATALGAVGCRGSDARPSKVATGENAARLAATRLAADSAAGDSAARAALPPALAAPLAVERYLTDRYVAATAGGDCLVQGAPGAAEVRRRVHLRLPDSSALVVFARADTGTLALRRVEVVRNPVGEEQLGFVWDAEGDRTTEVRWPARGRGHPETVPSPRGGPLPRALRALGRRLLTLACPAAGPPAQAADGEAADAGRTR